MPFPIAIDRQRVGCHHGNRTKACRVACETLVTTGLAFIAGEITTECYVDMPQIVRDTIKDIGYHSSQMGFDWRTCSVITSIDHQSPDIAQGVNQGTGAYIRTRVPAIRG
jgi:S-adenosylmethionine synthetase